MNLDKNLPALVMKNLEDNMGVITKYLKQTEDKALVFIIGETGSGKSCLAELEVPDALYPTAQQFEECDHISEMFTGFDVVIDDIFVLMLTKSWSVFWLCMLLAIRFWSPDNRQTMNCALV